MKNTSTSLTHWMVVGVILAVTTPLVALIIFGVFKGVLEDDIALLLGLAVAIAVATYMIRRSVPKEREAAEWFVDANGFGSASIGRCDYADVECAFRGFPMRSGFLRKFFQSRIEGGSSATWDQAIVIRSRDGRLLPINLRSPGIKHGEDAMNVLFETLEGKVRPHSEYTPAEVRALRGMTLNRWITVSRR